MSRVVWAAVAAVAALVAVVPAASAHQGNPNFRSQVRTLTPAVDGVDVKVVNFDDSIELTNRSDRMVEVVGYRGEPYVRIAADGTVEVNKRSPTYYLNDDRYAEGVKVPASADPKAAPQWETVDRTGKYAWHDHRIHWMARTVPPQVKDEDKRTKVFDWKVPLQVGAQPASIGGSLIWVGKQDGGFPLAAAVSLAVLALAGLVLVLVVQRRRRNSRGTSSPTPRQEAW